MYINYNTVRSVEYATAIRSVRKGKSITKTDQVYLGGVTHGLVAWPCAFRLEVLRMTTDWEWFEQKA